MARRNQIERISRQIDRRLLSHVDGKTRGIPTICNLIPSEKEATA
jgi:hypothetical protein